MVGLVVVLFIVLTENLGGRLYPAASPAWRRVLIPIAGSLTSGFFLFRYFPNARGSGIPQTKAALFLRDGHISFRTVLGKFGLCSLSLASGIALGREGPSVHVGAGIASTLGRKLRLSTASIKALIPIGASAALAAAFNTPISAVLFSLEEVMGDMHAPVLGSVVLSSATSWIVLHLILGDEPLFHAPAYQLVHPVEFVFYAALGLAGGLVSVTFVKFLLWQRKHFLRAPRRLAWVLPAVGGLTVGLMGWFRPEVLGVGYLYVSKALNGQMVVGAMALLVLLKIVATSTCYASGNAGGIFGPSLFIGAMMGGAVGGVAHTLLPDYTGSVGAYALVGMGAAFAGIVRAPLTSVIMIFEITRDYSIIVPLMISNLMSYFISSRLQEEPIYEALQHQDGVYLPTGARAREELLTVGHAYRQETAPIGASERIAEAAARVDRQQHGWAVVDEGGLCGVITIEQLDEAAATGRGDATVSELLDGAPPTPRVHVDDPLDAAMKWLANGRVKLLPVVSRTNLRELKGTISLADVLSAYAMSGAGEADPAVAETREGSRLLAGALAALVVVAVLGGVLSYIYRAERGKRAEAAYAAGNDLLAKDHIGDAIEQYRSALSISHKTEHRLALGLALVKAERTSEASIYLSEVLRQHPNSGPANLGMAEALAAEGQAEAAVVHYRRAIVGSWPALTAENRYRARTELIAFLKKSGRSAEARVELLALAADLPGDRALQIQAGRLLLDSGLASEAAELYRKLLATGPPDAAEYDGLGDALFRMGSFEASRDAYGRALSIDAADSIAARRAALLAEIAAMDPGQRGIPARERFRRSWELLRSAIAMTASCAGPDRANALAEAKTALARKGAPRSFSDAADENLKLAEALWVGGSASCGGPGDDAARVLLERMAAARATLGRP